MKILRLGIVTGIGIILVFACKHEVFRPPDTGGNTGGDNEKDSVICFESQILPIFINNCAVSGCHDAATHEKGYVFTSYDGIMEGIEPGDPEHSKIFEAITSNEKEDRMPKDTAPLPADQIGVIEQWINEGAHNTTNCFSGCDTSLYTYSAAVRPILDLNCVGCHNNSLQNAGVNLTTYTGVHAVALDGRLSGVINWSVGYPQMPFGGEKLSNCNITQIMKWIDDGAQNN
ncbi:MAG TPA: c-type cytochrome domain-containing protein [Parafilimonas sp.]|nr:c-type cytochrome domain-containing protein [Parafilimonas sp.]